MIYLEENYDGFGTDIEFEINSTDGWTDEGFKEYILEIKTKNPDKNIYEIMKILRDLDYEIRSHKIYHFTLSKEDVLSTANKWDCIMARIEEVVDKLGLRTYTYNEIDERETYITEKFVHVTLYDGSDDSYYSADKKFPLDLMFDDNAIDKYKQDKDNEVKQRQIRLAQEEKRIIEENERAEYERLKKKYGEE